MKMFKNLTAMRRMKKFENNNIRKVQGRPTFFIKYHD